MRKTIFLLTVIILLTASGCASTRKGEIFSEAPIALVSLVSNFDINWKGEEPISHTTTTGDAIRRMMRADEDWVIFTRADLIIEETEQTIRNLLENSPFITLAPKDQVFGSRSYNEARLNRVQENDEMIMPEGYRLIFHRDNNFFPAFARETGIERTLFITLDLTKAMSSGFAKNGNFRALVDMSVVLKNERGRTIFSRVYSVRSQGQTRTTSGAYSQEELLDLVRSAIYDASSAFLDSL